MPKLFVKFSSDEIPGLSGIVPFENKDEARKTLEEIGSIDTDKPWFPTNVSLDEKIVNAINERLRAMKVRKGGEFAAGITISILNELDEKNKKNIFETFFLNVDSSNEPMVGNKYDLPNEFIPIGNLNSPGAAGQAVGRGEFAAILMFGDDASGKEPDLRIPNGEHFSVKESKTASNSWEPGANEHEIKTWSQESAKKISEIIKLAGTNLSKFSSNKSFTFDQIKEIKNELADEDPKIEEIEKILEEWTFMQENNVSHHDILVYRGNSLHAVSKNDPNLIIDRIQVGRAPKIAWKPGEKIQSESSIAGVAVSGVITPLGTDAQGNPPKKSKKKVLDDNAKTQGKSFGNAKPIEEAIQLLSELFE